MKQKKMTLQEKLRLSKLLGIDLTGKTKEEINEILEEHDKELPGLDKWFGRYNKEK